MTGPFIGCRRKDGRLIPIHARTGIKYKSLEKKRIDGRNFSTLRLRQGARSRRYGISAKEGGHLTKPSEYADVPDSEFADPVNYRYPVDAGHVRAAWAYWNQPDNQKQYSQRERTIIHDRIVAAMRRHGHAVSEEALA